MPAVVTLIARPLGRALPVAMVSLCPEFEFCDDGNTVECDGCYGDCSRADNVCGDSILECAETCDDGNTSDDGNGCSAVCQRDGGCGDGILQPLFESMRRWFHRCLRYL